MQSWKCCPLSKGKEKRGTKEISEMGTGASDQADGVQPLRLIVVIF